MHTRIHNRKNFWAGSMFALLGGVFAAGALHYSLGSSARPGPGYFPLGLGVLLCTLGLALAASSIRWGSGSSEEAEAQPVGPWAWRPLLAVTAAVVLFGLLLPRAGLLLALPLAVVVSSLAESTRSWREVGISALVLTVAAYLLFVLGLQLVIPVWPAI